MKSGEIVGFGPGDALLSQKVLHGLTLDLAQRLVPSGVQHNLVALELRFLYMFRTLRILLGLSFSMFSAGLGRLLASALVGSRMTNVLLSARSRPFLYILRDERGI